MWPWQASRGADETHSVDINDAATLLRVINQAAPHYVYHLAALSFVGRPTPLDFYRVNVLGTEALLQALIALPTPPRALLASSANVYGACAQAVMDEYVPSAPVNLYVNSKIAREHIAHTYAEQLSMLIARPSSYTGPGSGPHFLKPKIVEHIKRFESVIELGNTHISRDFSDVRGIVSIYY